MAGENNQNLTLSQLTEGVSKEYTWVLRITINCIGYSGISTLIHISFGNSKQSAFCLNYSTYSPWISNISVREKSSLS